MKLMIVGAWAWPQYEEAFARGLSVAGVEVFALATSNHFNGILGRIQQTIPLLEPNLLRLNRAVVAAAIEEHPDLVLFAGDLVDHNPLFVKAEDMGKHFLKLKVFFYDLN